MSIRFLHFAGSTISFEYQGEKAERVFSAYFKDILEKDSGSADVSYRLIQEKTAAPLCLYEENVLEFRSESEAEVGQYLVDRIVYHLADHSHGGLVIHAAAVAFHGCGLLLAGPSGSGKTSLTAWLLDQGFDYLSDELVFIPSGELQMQGLARPLNIKPGSFQALEKILTAAGQFYDHDSDCSRRVIPPQALCPCKILQTVPLHCIVFPSFSRENSYNMKVLSKAQAGAALMACLINARNLSNYGFPDIARIAMTTPAFHMHFRQFDDIGARLKAVLSNLGHPESHLTTGQVGSAP